MPGIGHHNHGGARMKKHWYDYLWIVSLTYLVLGFFNIMFAWLGLLCFFIPLIIAIAGGSKAYCNRYCGRGQLFALVGGKFGLSRRKNPPRFLKSKWFRYGFLIFFFTMFFVMLWNTWMVFDGAQELRQVVKLLWDIQTALALGLSRNRSARVDGTVCFRLLQRYADLNGVGLHYHAAL
jgi:hypothetical protein